MIRLKDAVEKSLPCRPSLYLLTFAVDEIPVELTTSSIDVHLCGPEPTSALPEITADPESKDDEEGKVRPKEILSGTDALANGRDSSIEL